MSKKGWHIFVVQYINLFQEPILLVSFWTSLALLVIGISKVDFIWYGLAFIPLYVSKYLRNFPHPTLKVHFTNLASFSTFEEFEMFLGG